MCSDFAQVTGTRSVLVYFNLNTVKRNSYGKQHYSKTHNPQDCKGIQWKYLPPANEEQEVVV